jgi:hypothetical protein
MLWQYCFSCLAIFYSCGYNEKTKAHKTTFKSQQDKLQYVALHVPS